MKNSHLFEGMTDEEIIEAMDKAGAPYFSDVSEDDTASAVPADLFKALIKGTIKKAKYGDAAASRKLMEWHRDFNKPIDYQRAEKIMELHQHYIDQGNHEEARKMMDLYKATITPQSDPNGWRHLVACYFAECFAEYLKTPNMSLERAMNLQRDRNPVGKPRNNEQVDIAMAALRADADNKNLIETHRNKRRTQKEIYAEIGEKYPTTNKKSGKTRPRAAGTIKDIVIDNKEIAERQRFLEDSISIDDILS